MAKARLIDFRGGINDKISSHMIGDSQGQNAEDTDLGSVRLQGRIKLDTSTKAEGTFYYDTSDESTSRWVSTESEDTETYIEFSSDFAIWNRDLYVALGAENDQGNIHSDGLIVRFLDGAGTSSNVAVSAPGATSTVTIDEPGYDTQLIAQVPAQGQSGGDTGTVTLSQTVSTGDSNSRINYSWFTTSGYYNTNTYEKAAYGGRAIWSRSDATQFVVAASNGDGDSTSLSNDLMTFSGGSIIPSTVNVTTSNAQDYQVTSTGDFAPQRAFITVGSSNRYDTSGNYYVEYESIDLSQNGWAQNDSGTLYDTSTLAYNSYNQHLSTADLSIVYPTYTDDNSDFSDTRGGGVQTTSFDKYHQVGDTTTQYYVAKSTNMTLGVVNGYFYTQSGGGTSPVTQNIYKTTFDRNVLNTYPNVNGLTANNDWFQYTYSSGAGNGFTELDIRQGGLTNELIRISGLYNQQSYAGITLKDWAYFNYCTVFLANGTKFTCNVLTDGHFPNMTAAQVLDIAWVRFNRAPTTTGTGTDYYFQRDSFVLNTNSSSWSQWGSVNGDVYGWSSLDPYAFTIDFQTNTGSSLASYSIALANWSSFPLNSSDGYQWTYTKGSAPTYSNLTPSGASPTSDLVSYEILNTTATTNTNSVTRTRTMNVDYTYSSRYHTQNTAYNFSGTVSALLYSVNPHNYQRHTNSTPIVESTPATPAFTLDDAKKYIYQIYTVENPVLRSDSSVSTDWLFADSQFLSSDQGYFIKTVVDDGQGLPQTSNNETKLVATTTGTTFGTNGDNTPLLLDINPATPANTAAVAYKLRRVDSVYDVELGYINPATVGFSYSTSTKVIGISSLPNNKTYRILWTAYQDTLVSINGVSAKSNMLGYEFTINSSTPNPPAITLVGSSDHAGRFYAADFWIREKVLDGNSSITGDETWAIMSAYHVFHDAGTDGTGTTTYNTECSFIDGFVNPIVGSGVGAGDSSATDAPAYLRFLKESNNFFFGVGTENTPAARYGGVNKKGTFLFVSAYNDPTNWPTTGYVQFDNEITGLATFPGELIVFTKNAVYRVTGSRFDQMRKSKLATTEGLPNGYHKTISLVNNYLCWVSESGICVYNGAVVFNLTRSRFSDFSFSSPSNVHAGQYEDSYYVVADDEVGYTVDFSLEGFPVSRVDLKEDVANLSSKLSVLHYVGSQNKLYTRNGVVEQNASKDRNLFTYRTRAFDGGAFGSLKLVRNVTLNGTGSGTVQIYLDGQAVFAGSGQSVSIDRSTGGGTSDHPTRIYLPASRTNVYGLPVADVWSVEIVDWDGQIDWIDTEYEALSS